MMHFTIANKGGLPDGQFEIRRNGGRLQFRNVRRSLHAGAADDSRSGHVHAHELRARQRRTGQYADHSRRRGEHFAGDGAFDRGDRNEYRGQGGRRLLPDQPGAGAVFRHVDRADAVCVAVAGDSVQHSRRVGVSGHPVAAAAAVFPASESRPRRNPRLPGLEGGRLGDQGAVFHHGRARRFDPGLPARADRQFLVRKPAGESRSRGGGRFDDSAVCDLLSGGDRHHGRSEYVRRPQVPAHCDSARHACGARNGGSSVPGADCDRGGLLPARGDDPDAVPHPDLQRALGTLVHGAGRRAGRDAFDRARLAARRAPCAAEPRRR